jgi:5'(3')-deoxyribonucleotidase
MKIYDIVNEDGRIVKGVNTTPDVGVNQTSIEAAKFGNKVDKDGRPPTLSSKVKGSSTNVLFNMGLAESLPSFASAKASAKQYEKYVQDTFQAGKDGVDIYIDDGLEVTVDVIRKWGVNDTTVIKMLMDYYESRVGKVTEATFNMGLAESLDLAEAVGEIASATEIYVDMDGVLADFFGEWAKLMDVDHFSDIGKQHDINDALQKIRDTDDFWLRLPILPEAKNLLNLIKQVRGEYSICTSPLADDPNSEKHKRTWVEKNLAFFPPKEVHVTHNKPQFATAKDGTPNILIDDYGVNINAWEAAGGIGFKYKDHKFERTAKDIKQHIDAPVEENFADGKKKGKSRPGRVKKSGASCNGSVTALRKRAKKASGEKAKMLHWCANMKSGKNK